MTFTIPLWVFWVLGIPAGIVVLFLAWVGFMFLKAFSKPIW